MAAPGDHVEDLPRCAFTVDVEDWYQSCVDPDAQISDRVVRNVDRVLALLDDCNLRGTFFIQGRVAEAFPSLVQRLLSEGHEIQSHGYSHRPLFQMDRKDLRNELERARKSVEDASGARVTAFRAQDFSILPQNLWALEVLAEVGFTVDSSIFPMRTKRYGIAGWEITPHRIGLPNGAEILEVPVAVWASGGIRIPVAGGGYFRLLPKTALVCALRSIISSRPAVVYCHPYEFNARELDDYRGQVSPLTRFSQGIGRKSLIGRIASVIRELPFGRFDQVLAAWNLA